MTARFGKLIAYSLTLAQIFGAATLAVYAIWFADEKQRGVGALVIYTGTVALLIALCQLGLWMLYFLHRRERFSGRHYRRLAILSFIGALLLMSIAERYEYAGAPHASVGLGLPVRGWVL